MLKGVTLEDKAVIYELKLVPLLEEGNIIPDDEEHRTIINSTTYLFNEIKITPRKLTDNQAAFYITREIAKRYSHHAITYKMYNDGDLSIDIKRLKQK